MPAAIDLTPTAEMAANAERGLALREKHGKGGTEVGVARARDLKNRKTLSPDTVRKMHSFFSRHAGNEAGGEDDAGYIAWLLWGGDAGRDWAARKTKQLDKDTNMKTSSGKGAKAAFGTNKRVIRYAGHEFLAEDEGNRTRISIKVDGEWEHATTVNPYNQTATEWIESNAKPSHPSKWLPDAFSRPGAKAAFATKNDTLGLASLLVQAEGLLLHKKVERAKGILRQAEAIVRRNEGDPDLDSQVRIYHELRRKAGMSRPGAKAAFSLDAVKSAAAKVAAAYGNADNAATVRKYLDKIVATLAKGGEGGQREAIGIVSQIDGIAKEAGVPKFMWSPSMQSLDKAIRSAGNFKRPGAKLKTAKSTHAADDATSRKIATLIREGYPRDQAVAIAYDMKRRGEL